MDGSHPRRRRRRRRRRWVITTTAAAVVLCLALPAGWIGLRGVRARDHLLVAAALLRQLQTQISTADIPAAQATLAALKVATRDARLDTADPIWRAGAHLPGIGDDLGAVATIADVLDDLSHHGLPPLIAIAASADPTALTPRGGQIDVAALARAAPQIRAASDAMRQARDRIAGVNGAGLAASVASALAALRAELGRAVDVTATASLAATLLPPMLGSDRPRTYMMLFQNLAEVRASGGEMGAFAIVRADHGHLQMLERGTASGDLVSFPTPVLPLDPAMNQLYTSRLGRYPADVNMTPYFPTTAALARQMYHLRTGGTVDGVIATDPVALSYLLAATGPVPVGSGAPLTRDNAVQRLLSDVYFQNSDQTAQDRYFAEASQAIFDTLARGQVNPRSALDALTRAAAERRILIWSADPAEEAQLAGTVLGGTLPDTDGAQPTIGIFLNDGTGAKLGYYLTRAGTVTVGPCRRDGRRELQVSVTLGSTAPASGLPDMVRGFGDPVPRYTLRTNVMIFSPTDGAIGSATRDGAPSPLGTGTERGRAVGVLTVELRPGQRSTVTVGVLTGVLSPALAGGFTPTVRTTPGLTSWPVVTSAAAPC